MCSHADIKILHMNRCVSVTIKTNKKSFMLQCMIGGFNFVFIFITREGNSLKARIANLTFYKS